MNKKHIIEENGSDEPPKKKKHRKSNLENGETSAAKESALRTVSIALPGSVLANRQSPALAAHLASQIGRAAAIFNVAEIVVFDESASMTESDCEGNVNAQMVRLLEYLECPQYLRKLLFPLSKELRNASVMEPLHGKHHLGAHDLSIPYREAAVVHKPPKPDVGSYVDAGFRKEVLIDHILDPGTRVTIRLEPKSEGSSKFRGTVVSPREPTLQLGIYWGYTVRLARSLSHVFTDYSFDAPYDLLIGTSERGRAVEELTAAEAAPTYKHALIVFGGLAGLEACLENDERLPNIDNPAHLFDHYVNTCPTQGSNVIRTEEAILISLSAMRTWLSAR